MPRILALWATPRSTSTAFEWAIDNRGDMTCLHEPYNEAYYLGKDRRNDRYFAADPELKVDSKLSFSGVHAHLLQIASDRQVFIKDFAYSIMHIADDAFLDAFRHTFLIRDPKKVITSLHARWPDIALDEVGFEDLHTLYQRVADRTGEPPVVLDSDELLDDPEAGMKAYCQAVGIRHIAASTQWQDQAVRDKGSSPTWSTYAYDFHDQLRASVKLSRQKRNYPTLNSNPDMQRLYAASRPHYDSLYEKRLRF